MTPDERALAEALHPWRYGYDEGDANRPCWTCGAPPDCIRWWNAAPFPWNMEHLWPHSDQQVKVDAESGEWIIPEPPAPHRPLPENLGMDGLSARMAAYAKGERARGDGVAGPTR